jgi:hypothetical protein
MIHASARSHTECGSRISLTRPGGCRPFQRAYVLQSPHDALSPYLAHGIANRQVPDGQAGVPLAWLPIIGFALAGRPLGRAMPSSLRISGMPVISLFKKGAFDPETTSLLASAFETAWETVKKSGSPLAANGQALSTREILAKRIIELAQAGERDPAKLTSDALAYLNGSR